MVSGKYTVHLFGVNQGVRAFFVFSRCKVVRYGYYMEMKQNEVKSETPWGTWEVLLEAPTYKIKRITVHPGHRMSYQRHEKRSEHWYVVHGQALITLDDREQKLVEGNSIDIPKGMSHRIKNVGSDPLVFVEVQTGSYFGEDDNTRLHDDYGRS